MLKQADRSYPEQSCQGRTQADRTRAGLTMGELASLFQHEPLQAAGLSILRGWAAVGVRPIAPTTCFVCDQRHAALVLGGIGLFAATEAIREWRLQGARTEATAASLLEEEQNDTDEQDCKIQAKG